MEYEIPIGPPFEDEDLITAGIRGWKEWITHLFLLPHPGEDVLDTTS